MTTFELFFDLVFVFAFTQVTHYMAATHSAIGVLQALTILSLPWWSGCPTRGSRTRRTSTRGS